MALQQMLIQHRSRLSRLASFALADIRISMDGRDLDGQRLHRAVWRSLKYECVYLNASENRQ